MADIFDLIELGNRADQEKQRQASEFARLRVEPPAEANLPKPDIFDLVSQPEPAATPPNALKKAASAVYESPGQTESLVAPAIAESGAFGAIARPVARAALRTAGTLFAPAAGVGSLAGSAAQKMAENPTVQAVAESHPLGRAVIDIGRRLGVTPETVGKAADIAAQAGLPTGVATGGISLIPKAVGAVARGVGLSKVVGEAGGFKGAIAKVAEKALGGGATGRQLEQAGQDIGGAEQIAAGIARQGPSRAIEAGKAAVPEGFKISSSFADAVERVQSPLAAARTPVQNKAGKLAGEFAPEAVTDWRDLKYSDVSIGGQKLRVGQSEILRSVNDEIQRTSPELRDAYLTAIRKAGGAEKGMVDIDQLDSLRRELSRMQRTVKSDADGRFLASARNAVEADINKMGESYPEAIGVYRQGLQQYKTEVAPWFTKGAPFRDLVDVNEPSQMIAKLEKMPIEHIRNVISGLRQAPDAPQVMQTVQRSVMSNLFTNAFDPATNAFNARNFIKQISEPQTAQKLAEILGREKYANLQHFTGQMKEIVEKLGTKTEQGSPILRFMGFYHLVRGAQEAAIGLPMAFYQFSAAGLMLMTPKLAGMMSTESRIGSKLLAEALGTKAGPTTTGISQAMQLVARGLGGLQIPTTAARAIGGGQ